MLPFGGTKLQIAGKKKNGKGKFDHSKY